MKIHRERGISLATFDRSGSVSAFIKAMRFGDFPEAGYWMTVLLENGTDEQYLAQRLAIFATEDTADPATMTVANSVLLLYAQGLGNNNMLWQVLFRCCRAPKFWETDAGRTYELESDRAIARYQEQGIEEIPTWAVDRHTALFRQRIKAGRRDGTDERFGGTPFGRRYMLRMYERYGRLDATVHDPDLEAQVRAELQQEKRGEW